MRTSSRIVVAPSIVAAATSGSDFDGSWQRILGLVRTFHPKGTARWLHRRTGCGIRTAYRWLAGRARPNAVRALAILAALRAEHTAHGKLLEQFEFDFS